MAGSEKVMISPLAPDHFPTMPEVAGVRLASCHAGIRYKASRHDVMLAQFCAGTVSAGVFTRSLTASAPIEHCREALQDGGGAARYLLVNSGNSNAFTGKRGKESVAANLKALCDIGEADAAHVFIASTGVIGEPLPYEKISASLPALHDSLAPTAWHEAAQAIMTTDTFAKGSSVSFEIEGKQITINGFAKGSGMIAPDMATMLAFVFTDAAIEQPVLQAMLARTTNQSFNSITVDSDTSTSDTAMVFATGKAGNAVIEANGDDAALFEAKLQEVMSDLARQIVCDGEGASKFVTIEITGAESDEAARRIGLAIGNSPLVKTAIAGEDPNWGRIVMAVGKSGERADRDALKIWIGDTLVAAEGQRVDGYDETPVAVYMKSTHVTLKADVGIANGAATIWTCDLTKRYIEINADYRS